MVAFLGFCLAACGSEKKAESPADLLPTESDLDGWTQQGTPTVVTDEGGLTLQINGAAQKYIDRGWVSSVFVDYTKDTLKFSVEIYDMATAENARDIYDYDMPDVPIQLWNEDDSAAVLDDGLASGYALYLQAGRYFVKLSISEKTQTERDLIEHVAEVIRGKV